MSNNNQNSQRVDADSNHIVIHHWKDPEGSSSRDSSSGPIPNIPQNIILIQMENIEW
jgi:hypothetical protein